MTEEFLLRALESHLDNQKIIANHLDSFDWDENTMDEKIIAYKLFAAKEIEKCNYEINKLKSTNHDRHKFIHRDNSFISNSDFYGNLCL